MDTTWFAVDKHGFVGLFDTEEPGAVPYAALTSTDHDERSSAYWPIECILAARALLSGDFPEPLDDPFPQTFDENVVALMRPDPSDRPSTYRDAAGATYAAQRLLDSETLVLRDRDPRVVCSLRPLTPKTVAALRLAPGVERVVSSEDIRIWLEEDEVDGIHLYAARDYEKPALYSRERAPVDPLLVDDLPDDVASEVRKLELPLEFAGAQTIDLAEHFRDDECATWGDHEISGEEKPGTPFSTYLFLALAVLIVLTLIRYVL